jgi:hypothetical protein
MSTYTITQFHDGKSNMCALYEKFHECDQISQIWGIIDGLDIDIVTYWDRVEEKVLVYANGPYIYVTNDHSISTMDVLRAVGLPLCEANVIMQWDKTGEVLADNKILDMPISETPLSHIMIQHAR